MKIVEDYPPNFSIIREALPKINKEAIYCFGDTIFNPSKKKLSPDIIHHEEVHQRQQSQFTSPDIWWQKYLLDSSFRLSQEREAYGEQYKFAKEKGVTGKLLEWAKENVALALSSEDYGKLCSYGEAESWIRNYSRDK